MTARSLDASGPGRLSRLARLLLDAGTGALLCAGPITALVALGWLTRRQGRLVRTRFGLAEEAPGWLFGPHELRGRPATRMTRALGGLAANVRAGVLALAALLVWTLPFSLLWLGAWWAGWENSFNKGYEQAAVGPLVFLSGAALAALILPVLPLVLAHLAAEDRLSAAFDLRRLRGLAVQAGWRVPALMLLATVLAFPFTAARGLIATAPDWAPWVGDLPASDLAALQGQIGLGLGALAFLSAWLLRSLAARAYATAAPRAAGLSPGLWDGTGAAEAARPGQAPHPAAAVAWYVLAMAFSLPLSFQILAGQFLDHAWWRWVFHPALTLPWAG